MNQRMVAVCCGEDCGYREIVVVEVLLTVVHHARVSRLWIENIILANFSRLTHNGLSFTIFGNCCEDENLTHSTQQKLAGILYRKADRC